LNKTGRLIEPVQETKKTIGEIAHSLIARANVFANPGVLSVDIMSAPSQELRKLSSKLQSHLFLVPKYELTAKVFRLPSIVKHQKGYRHADRPLEQSRPI
jgi:hypothetical protein